MPRSLPLSDIRAVRQYLLGSDCALAEGPEYQPSGHIDKDVWWHLVGLPDSVLLETTDGFSLAMETIDEIGWSWLKINDRFENTSPMYDQTLSALESFQGAAFNAATGWYRIAGTILRLAFEDILLGLYYETRAAKKADFDEIVSGRRKSPRIKILHDGIREHTPGASDLLEQSSRLYTELSVYVHRIANNFIWESNGPVFVSAALEAWIGQYERTYRLSCKLIDAVRPGTEASQIAGAIQFKKT